LGDSFYTRWDIVDHPRAGKVIFSPERFSQGSQPALITSLVSSGGILYKGTDLATAALKQALEEVIVTYDLKFFIQDDNSNWVDFTERSEHRGRNALRKLGNITYSAERLQGQLQQSVGRIVLSNEDGFWDRPFPATLKATFDQNFVPIAPTTASFRTSENGSESALYRHKAAIRAYVEIADQHIAESITLAVILIEDIDTNLEERSATLKFVSLSDPLIEANAEKVKDGTFWYINRSPKFLVEKLLKTAYANTTGALPSTFDIEDITNLRIPAQGTGSNSWAQSHLGRPPELTYTNASGTISSTATWQPDKGIPCRAHAAWTYSTGTIAVTVGSNVITGTSTSWVTASGNLLNDLRVGDTLIIARRFNASADGGSSSGHHGYYTILSVDVSGQTIELNKTPPGTENESGLTYSVVRLYLGVGSNLYEYNIAQDRYTELTTSNAEIGQDYDIRRIWINTADTAYPIYVGSLCTLRETASSPCPLKVHKFRWNGISPDLVQVVSVTSVSTGITLGDLIHRESDRHVLAGARIHSIGNVDAGGVDTDQVPITIPYEQTLQETRGVSRIDILKHVLYEDAIKDITSPYTDIYEAIENVWNARLERGHYTAIASDQDTTDNIRVKYSSGTSGFWVLNPSWGSKGTILWANGQDPTIDSDDSGDTAPMREFLYIALDLATGSVTDVSGDDLTGGTAATSGTYDKYNDYTPTCGTVDEEGNVYVGMTLFRANMDSTEVGSRAAIIRISSISTTATEVLFHQTGGGGTFGGEIYTEFIHTIDGSNKRLYTSTYFSTNEGAGTNNRYKLQWIDTTTGSPTETMVAKHVSNNAIQGLGSIDVGYTGNPSYKIFFYESNASQVKHISDDGGVFIESPSTIDDGSTQNTDTHIMDSFVTWIPEVKEAYWISANIPVPVSVNDLSGKWYLSKWSCMFPVRIELAQFEGMNAWDAISHLAEIADAKFGFHPDGNFFFKETPRHYGSAYTFTNVSGNRLVSIDKGRGQSEIVNLADITPNRVILGDIDIGIELTQDSKYKTGEDRHVITVSQRDIYPKTITLKCIKGGRIATSSADTRGAEFEFRVYESSIQTSLVEDYDNAGVDNYSLEVEDASGVRMGSFVTVKGVDSNLDKISSTGFVGIQVKYNVSAELILSAAIGENTSDIPLTLSSGTLDLSQDVELIGRPLQSGDVLLIGKLDASDPQWEYVQVIYKDTGNDALYVSRSVQGASGGIDHDSSSKVWLIRNANQVYLKAALSNSFDLEDGSTEVTFAQPSTDTSSINYVVDPTDATSAKSTYRTWKPILNKYVSIGQENSPYDTELSMQLAVDSSFNSELKFAVGDIIRIKAEGLVLEEDSTSVQSAVDAVSIQTWKRRESPRRQNPFIGLLQARWLAIKEVLEEKNPKYTFTIESILVPWISQLEVVTIQDQDMLPMSSQFSQKAYISSITMSPQTRGAMTLVLRGIAAY